MSRMHTVRQGECLSSIARKYGLKSWQSLYEHPENERFRSIRKDPNILSPGDKIVIPDPVVKTVSGSTESLHSFRVTGDATYLRLNLMLDVFGEGAIGKYRLEVEGLSEPLEGELGEDGAIDVPIPPHTTMAKLSLFNAAGSQLVNSVELRIGELDPVEALSGVQARLNALRFDCGEVDGVWGEKTESAVRRFQKSLAVTDEEAPYGQATIDKLVVLYGS